MDFRSLDFQALAQSGRLTNAEAELAKTIAVRQAAEDRSSTRAADERALVEQIFGSTETKGAKKTFAHLNAIHKRGEFVEQIFGSTEPMGLKETFAHLNAMRKRGELNQQQRRDAQFAVLMDYSRRHAEKDNPMLQIAETLTEIPPQDPVQRLDWQYLVELNQTYMQNRLMLNMLKVNGEPVMPPSPPARGMIVFQCSIGVIAMVMTSQICALVLDAFNPTTSVGQALGVLLLLFLSIPSILLLYSAYRERGFLGRYQQFQQRYQEQRAELVKKQRFAGF